MLVVVGVPLQRVDWAGPCIHFALTVIDIAITHDLLYFQGRDLPALHPAPGVFGVFDIRDPAIKSAITVYILCLRIKSFVPTPGIHMKIPACPGENSQGN